MSLRSASCINNSWGCVEINGGTITSGAACTIKNCGSLRMNGGTVATSNAEGTVIDCTGNFGGTWINGGTIKGGEDGILLKDLGSFGVTLTQATFEGNTNDIHLGDGQKIDIKKTFTGTATILTDDAKRRPSDHAEKRKRGSQLSEQAETFQQEFWLHHRL